MATLLAWVGAAGVVSGTPTPPTPLRELVNRLERHGRGAARVVQFITSGPDTIRRLSGRLALEPPGCLRLDDAVRGEVLTVRDDGGEWLQPEQRQLLVLGAHRAAQAGMAWRLLLDGGGSFRERRGRDGRWWLHPAGADGWPDSAAVTVQRDGLPRRIELWVGEERWDVRFTGWTFGRARGPAAFTQRAPAGHEVVPLP